MSTSGYGNPFSVCYTIMKIRYADYDNSIDSLKFLVPGDKVNVFINFESVLKNLSMVKDLDSKLIMERQFPTILESEAINLCAHYKKFFRSYDIETRVFLYCTALDNAYFSSFKYNDEYRSYYINKYLKNPKYQLMGNKMVSTIIPRVSKIMEFIPGVHFITASGFEGSLIPLIIANENPEYKNFIITEDVYDTQYMLHKDKFCTHLIKRSPVGTGIFYRFDRFLSDYFKENLENSPEFKLLSNPSFYATLLGALGSKKRSIEPLKGIGCKTIVKLLNDGINNGIITDSTNSFEMIKNIFPEEIREKAENNFNCINLGQQYKELTQQQIFSITNQINDRFDHNSLIELNNKDYKDFPLMLEELTC